MDTDTLPYDQSPSPDANADTEEQRRLAREVDAANPRMLDIWIQLTLEALADVDAGRLIDDEDMQVWLERLETDHEPPLPVPR